MPACSNCRKRKVKCDGRSPVCDPCASRRHLSSSCEYHVGRHTPLTAEHLPRGDACLPCRRKKKKCNGHRPACSTCITAKKEDGCFYNDGSTRPDILIELEGLLGSVYWPQSPESLPVDTSPVNLLVDVPLPENTGLPPSESFWPFTYWTTQDAPTSSPPASLTGNLCPSSIVSSTARSSTPASSTASHGAPVDSFAPQIFDSSQHLGSPIEEYLGLQTTFMQSGIVLGQSLTPEKWQAVHIGDTSWNVVHPAFIHLARLFGATILNRSRQTPVDEIPHLNCALILLNSVPPTTTADAISHIQCYCLLAVHFMKASDHTIGREWLLKADSIVRQFDLHITPPTGGSRRDAYSPQCGTSENVPFRLLLAESEEDEKRDALCQLLYIDSACSLRMRLPMLLSPQLRQEFDSLLLHYLTHMKDASMTVIRMSSLALLQEARTVMMEASLGVDSLSSKFSVPTRFVTTIRRIHLYLADLNELMLAISSTEEDRPKYLMLQQCTLFVSTALASLYHQLSPGHPELLRKCIDAIGDIVGTSDRLSKDDCGQMDPIISVCWSIVLNMSIQIQQQMPEGRPRDPGNYSAVQNGQIPTFIEVLKACSQKVKWSFPLSGGMTLDV